MRVLFHGRPLRRLRRYRQHDAQILQLNAPVVSQTRIEKVGELAGNLHPAETAPDHHERGEPSPLGRLRLQLRLRESGDDAIRFTGVVSSYGFNSVCAYRGINNFAIRPVHPVWCAAPTPRPLSPWKYS
jgi:hypothetical protein